MTKRKQSRQPPSNGRFGQYAHDGGFVVDDEEDEDYMEEDGDEDDGFEPLRDNTRSTRAQAQPTKRVGHRITSDETMDSLSEMHRLIVESFLPKAKTIASTLQNNYFLHAPPFSDTVLRQMAIRFTETEEDMLRIPGADPEKVRLHGKHFTKLIKDHHRQYKEMTGGDEESRVLDPNLQNVIDLVSDDEDENDDYGPEFDGSDMEDDDGEASNYFQPDARVQAFNQKFANSQLANANSYAGASQAQSGRKTAAKPRKQKWRARGSTSYGKRSTSDGGSRGVGSRASGRGGASSKRAPKRSAAGGTKRAGASSGGGFSAMPT